MHPELTTKVQSVIYECWRAGQNKELGKVKISAAGVYDRLQLQKTIRLSELPLSGKILAVYKSIGSKPQASSAGSYKRGRPLSNAGVSGGKKAKVRYSDCDKQKDLLKWNKQELPAYLIHHNLKKSGNKPDLLLYLGIHVYVVDAIIANVRKSGYKRRAATPPLNLSAGKTLV